MKPLTFGSLFAGIGGFDLGLERAGMVCKWQVEINPFCRKVLKKHWPRVRRCKDVKAFPPEGGSWEVDVVCGGFPCQDISTAGKGAGIAEGTRSGLWADYARIVRLLRPRYVVVENVSALLARGMERVLGDLAACGYDCEWDCVPAAAVGAPHLRERIFIIAYLNQNKYPGGYFGGQVENNQVWEHTQGVEKWSGRFAQLDAVGLLTRSSSHARTRGILDGIPDRVDRLGALGNAVVPQVAEFIGRLIVKWEEAHA